MSFPFNDHPKGVDISHNNNDHGPIDFDAIKGSGISFIYIKASLTHGHSDPKFADNWSKAKAAGLITGPYHYMYHNPTATKQAEIFCDAVGQLESGDLPPVLDLEVIDPLLKISDIKTWLSSVESTLGVKPIIYTNIDCYNRYDIKNNFPDYKLWMARYANPGHPHVPPVQDWLFWQYKQYGSVEGVTGNVDLDVFNGTATQLQEILVK